MTPKKRQADTAPGKKHMGEDAPLLSLFEGHTWSGRKMGEAAGESVELEPNCWANFHVSLNL